MIDSSFTSTNSIHTNPLILRFLGWTDTILTGKDRESFGHRTVFATSNEESKPSGKDKHIRCNYGSKLSMIDYWFGKVLDALDAQNLWNDTMVILCTDHRHYLGEKDIWGKTWRTTVRAAWTHAALYRISWS